MEGKKRIGTTDSRYYKTYFRQCTVADFTARGVEVDDEFKRRLRERLCPDLSKLGEEFRVKNEYNSKNRISFSMEIVKCNPEINKCDLDNLDKVLE